MNYQLINGELVDGDKKLIDVSNRGFCYGDGFFESIRVSNGKVLFAPLHWKRLQHACSVLRIQIPEPFNQKTFCKEILRLVKANQQSNSRIRFQGFRAGKGRYTPTDSVLGWAMVSEPMDLSTYQLNKKGLTIGICRSHTINPLPQSGFKSSNSIPYVLGGIEASDNGWDDCLLLDSSGCLAEATGSNLFLVVGNKLVTPDLQNGGVPGVMRSVILNEAKSLGLEIELGSVQEQDLLVADELFLTTATRGITWVGAFEKKRYFKRMAEKLTQHINNKITLN